MLGVKVGDDLSHDFQKDFSIFVIFIDILATVSAGSNVIKRVWELNS